MVSDSVMTTSHQLTLGLATAPMSRFASLASAKIKRAIGQGAQMTNAEYWRVHEEEYRAMARSWSSEDGRRRWTGLADRCAAMVAAEDIVELGGLGWRPA